MDALVIELEDIRRRAKEVVAGLNPEQLTQRPEPGKWSIAECLAHLNKTATGFTPLIDAAIRQGKEQKILGKGPFQPGVTGRLLKWIAEPPPKFRLRAPKVILPPASIPDPHTEVKEFMHAQDEWERLLRDADGLDLEKVKVAPPLRGLPRLRLGACVPWMLAHERRHLLQAERVREQIMASSGQRGLGSS